MAIFKNETTDPIEIEVCINCTDCENLHLNDENELLHLVQFHQIFPNDQIQIGEDVCWRYANQGKFQFSPNVFINL